MNFKIGDRVTFIAGNCIDVLKHQPGIIIGFKGDCIHVIMDDLELTPQKNGVLAWDKPYWTPYKEQIRKLTKLEQVLK